MKHELMACVALTGLVLTGCGGTDAPPPQATADVSGKVTVAGKPLNGAGMGIGFSTSSAASDVLNIDENGMYSGKAPVGQCKVIIIPVAVSVEGSPPDGEPDADTSASPDGGHTVSTESGVLDKYTSDDTTTHSVDVKADVANTFDFEVGQ
jgi:hypothetical protein